MFRLLLISRGRCLVSTSILTLPGIFLKVLPVCVNRWGAKFPEDENGDLFPLEDSFTEPLSNYEDVLDEPALDNDDPVPGATPMSTQEQIAATPPLGTCVVINTYPGQSMGAALSGSNFSRCLGRR